ncbi:uncharacterized protein [Montipora capricornis]|uniref:uncharacterized protein isoform X2 n=1 Tax=Montipora capricornis TaxID=246305 RepID=UPI0035F1C30E
MWTEDVSGAGFKIFLRELTNSSGGHKGVVVQWIAFVMTPKGWKMPEKSKIEFENEEPRERKTQYSFCQVVNVHWLAFRGQPTGSATGIIEIPFWTTGSSHVGIIFPSNLYRVLEVFVTPIHRHPWERKSAASIWTEDVSGARFKIFLRELTNFNGGHKGVVVQWIAFVTTPKGWKMPEKSKIEFENEEPPERKTQYSFCQDEKFQSPFYQTPVLLLSPSHKWIRTNALYINPGNNAITSWIENINSTHCRVCMKELHSPLGYDPVNIDVVAIVRPYCTK